MTIPTKILQDIKIFVEDEGITTVCKKAKVNYRRLKKALNTGRCDTVMFSKLVNYLKPELKQISKSENELK